MHGVIAWLNQVLFSIGSDAVTPAELLGFVTGLGSVYLIVKERVLNFPISIANAIFFLVLFLNAKLFADGYLQLVYVGLSIVGWWAWLKAGPQHTELRVQSANPWWWALAAAIIVIGTYVLTPALRNIGDSAPFLDALTSSTSIAAQTLLTFKIFENWYLWIAVDLVYIPLYFYRHLYLTAVVYIFFLALCCVGVVEWHRSRRLAMADAQ